MDPPCRNGEGTWDQYHLSPHLYQTLIQLWKAEVITGCEPYNAKGCLYTNGLAPSVSTLRLLEDSAAWNSDVKEMDLSVRLHNLADFVDDDVCVVDFGAFAIIFGCPFMEPTE